MNKVDLNRISNLKYVVRSGWIIRGVPNALAETVAGHTFEVTLISMYLADELRKCAEIDVEKILKMSLIHDIPEVVIGDVVKLVKSKVPELFNNIELEAMSELGLSNYANLMEELNKGLTPEAKLVKLSDLTATYLQGTRYLKTGHEEVREIITNTRMVLSELVSTWTPEECSKLLRKLLKNLGVDLLVTT